MKVQLLVSDRCASCRQAEMVWREVSEERDFEFSVAHLAQPEERELVNRLHLKAIPALVVDDKLVAVGFLNKRQALDIVAAVPPKTVSRMRHVGLGMSLSGRGAVYSSMLYLIAAGGFLAFNGLLFLSGFARVAPLHLFTLGFLTFLVYALAEHMLPRFTSNPIRTGAMVWWQLGMAVAGVLTMVAGSASGLRWLALAGAASALLALLLFVLRIWPVLWPQSREMVADRQSSIRA